MRTESVRLRHLAPLLVVLALAAAGLACSSGGGSAATAAPAQPMVTERVIVVTAPVTPVVVTVIPVTPVVVTVAAPLASGGGVDLVELYKRVNPAVVAITVDMGSQGTSLGSGFVYDAEGHIVTNHHVVGSTTDVEVAFASGTRVMGRVIGVDEDSDLAVIKVDVPASELVPLPLADSDALQVGQHVVAIGNPFGLDGTMTEGIISGLGRMIDSDRQSSTGTAFSVPDTIQTDAPINPGNSGGPLIDEQGQVVGVNRMIESLTGVNSGVGFAVASNTVKQVVPYLIKDGKFVYSYLGLTGLQELSLTMQEVLSLPQTSGVYVTSVTPGGPSAEAGVTPDSGSLVTPTSRGESATLVGDGDLVIAIDAREVRTFHDLLSYLVNHTRPGQTVTLTLIRKGETLQIPVVLGERP